MFLKRRRKSLSITEKAKDGTVSSSRGEFRHLSRRGNGRKGMKAVECLEEEEERRNSEF
jgi:hypothetical protein